MPDDSELADEIASQLQLLATHRRTLAHLLQQAAQFSAGFVPTHILNGIDDCRNNIKRIKADLRTKGQVVADHPDDSFPATDVSNTDKINEANNRSISSALTVARVKIIVAGGLIFALFSLFAWLIFKLMPTQINTSPIVGGAQTSPPSIQQTTSLANTVTPTIMVTTTPSPPTAIPAITEEAIADFSGTWMTNVAMLNVTQEGAKVVVVVQGYGGNWNSFIEGSIEGKMVQFKGSDLFDKVILKLSDDDKSFISTNPDFSFCGVRAGPLPSGCGFSGKWNIRASGSRLPADSYAILVQTGSKVEGTLYESTGHGIIDRITGDVEWGKGWELNGKGIDKLPAFYWNMQSSERGFEGYSNEGNISWAGQRASAMPSETPIFVNGRVVDSDGQPISGVDVAVSQQDANIHDTTGDDGSFSVSLPSGSAGRWNIHIAGVKCTSRIIGTNCYINDYVGIKTTESILLPQNQEVVLVYEKATTSISGKVLNEKGQPVGMRVRAERSDGANSWINSSQTGEFKLPVVPGIWEVFAVDYNPYREGKRMQVQVDTNATPLPITIIFPSS